jgi:RNA polymerase sigma-70 factor (ECF subfamily)
MDDVVHGTSVRPTSTSRSDQADAFIELLSQARLDRAYRFAAAVLRGSSADAQDAVHDAAVRAWTHWAGIHDAGAFDAWFDRIVVNVCRDRMRARRRITEVRMEPAGPSLLTSRASFGVLSDSFDKLSSEHRIVVALRYLDDLSLDEIARRTHSRLGTVKSRLHYALRVLRADYDAARRKEPWT